MTLVFAGLAVFWLLVTALDLRAVAALQALPPSGTGPAPDVTVVLAARDDAHLLRGSIDDLLQQEGVRLRLVVVDDRSDDGTAALLAALAAAEPRLTARRVAALPHGWLGKPHALHLGARDADTEWLLFSDSDVRLRPSVVRRAIDAAVAAGVEHVVLVPSHRHTTLWGRACLLPFHEVLVRRLRALTGSRPGAFVGVGAFNLVRTEAYGRIGGHLPLRFEVVEDLYLGYLLRRAGCRTRAFLAGPDLSVDWGGTPLQLLRAVEKNLFAALRYRTWLAALLVVGGAPLLLLPWFGPWLGGAPGTLALLAFLLGAWPGVHLARAAGWTSASGLLLPFARAWLLAALVRSTAATLWRGGVRWRGTFYPLAGLRAGCVR